MLTPEKIKAFDQITGFTTPTSTNSRAEEIRALGNKYQAADLTSKAPPSSSPQTLFGTSGAGKVANSLTSSEQALGNDLTAGFRAGLSMKDADLINAANSNGEKVLLGIIAEHKAKGVDASHFEEQLRNMRASDAQNNPYKQIAKDVPEVNKTNEQGLGDVFGTATDALIPGLSAPAYFGLKSASGAMSENKDLAGVATDALIGTLTGKVLEVGFKAASPLISKAISKYGAPVYDKLAQYIPDAAKSSMKSLADQTTKNLSLGSGTGGTKVLEKVNQVFDAPFQLGGKTLKFVVKAPLNAVANKTVGASLFSGAETRSKAAIDTLENDYYKWSGQTKSGLKTLNKAETKTGMLNKAGTEGATPMRTLAENKIVPETSGSKFTTDKQAEQFIKDKVTPLNDKMDELLPEVKYQTQARPISELEQEALDNVSKIQGKTVSDVARMRTDIQNEFKLLREKYPKGTMDVLEQQAEKKAYNAPVKFDAMKPLSGDTNYQMGKAFKDSIQKQSSDAGFEGVAQLNREIGDRLEAGKFLNSLNGNTLKGGRLGKYAFTLLGSTFGKTIPGKVVGALGGDAVAQLLMKSSVSNPLKQAIIKSIAEKDPAVLKEVTAWLEKQGIARQTQLALPAPKSLGTVGNPIIPPAPTTFEKGVAKGTTQIPTLKVGGKTMTLDEIHTQKGTQFFESLSPADKVKFTEFDRANTPQFKGDTRGNLSSPTVGETVPKTFEPVINQASKFKTFDEFENSMTDKVFNRESGARPEFSKIDEYVKYPLQEIPLNKIDNYDQALAFGKEHKALLEKGSLKPGESHGQALGRPITEPIAVDLNEDGTYTIVDGYHRPIQSVINGDENIVAFVKGGKGPTLKELYMQAKKP